MRTLCILVMIAIAAPAAADNRADDRADAEALFRIGAGAYKAGKYTAAAENFERAYELFKAPEIAFSAAQAHRQAYLRDGKPTHVKRAIALFEAYVAATARGQGKRKDAEAHLETLRGTLAKLEASGEKVVVAPVKETPSIYVSVALDGALITVDGKAVERYTPLDVSPGEHTVEVSADGYRPLSRKVTVTKGQAIVPVELLPEPARVTVRSQAGARISFDGRPVGAGTVEIPSGKRFLAVHARGRETVTRELDLLPGQEVALDVPLHPTTRRRAVKWVWIGSGLLLASTVVTAIVATSASFSAADLRDSADPLDERAAAKYEERRDRRDNFRTASFVLGGVTLVTAATALWLYYFDTPSPDELGRPVEHDRKSGFAPLALTDGLGLQYGGVFR